MMREIFVDIQGYEGLYQVSNLGKVKSLSRYIIRGFFRGNTEEIVLKPRTDKNGYLYISLLKDRQYKTYLLHRLVAKTFISNPKNKPQVNHKNGIKADNSINNLEWVTSSENHKHAYSVLNRIVNKGMKGKFGKDNHLSKKVIALKDELIIYKFDSVADAFRELHIRHISECCNGKASLAGGYKWRYINASI